MTDYTDIVATFADQLAADTLAKFIAETGVTCDVVEQWDLGPVSVPYAVRVQRDRIGELKRILDLKPVANRLTFSAGQIMAAQLARADVPSYVGGWHSFRGSYFQLDAKRTLIDTKASGFMIAVPASHYRAAMRILNQPPISEAELAKLALSTPPDPEDPP